MPEVVKEWSKCVIENRLYIYREGEANIWRCAADNSVPYSFEALTPTGITMSGQMGIFRAGGRLGIWDSDNAIGISSFDNLVLFTPDIGTGANITTLLPLIGNIVAVHQHGEGFIVYATKSIIAVRKDPSNTFGWKAETISNVAGILYRGQVTVAAPDTVHFVWTSIGLMRIENFRHEILAPELYDFLKEGRHAVYLKMLEGRYLFVQLDSADYVNGIATYYVDTINGTSPSNYNSYTYPSGNFLMQASPATPYDITWEGAYVYDTHLKRWGKFKGQYRQIIDLIPINSHSLGAVNYTQFGIQGGIINTTGEIRVFDANPTDSYLKFGKIGLFRYGYTTLETVRGDFRRPCTGSMEIETSLDGRSVETSLTRTYTYTSSRQINQGITDANTGEGNSGRWHNISFKGQFDLSYLEFKAWVASRR